MKLKSINYCNIKTGWQEYFITEIEDRVYELVIRCTGGRIVECKRIVMSNPRDDIFKRLNSLKKVKEE